MNDPRLGSWVEDGPHKKWSHDYQKDWESWFKKMEQEGTTPSKEDVFEKAKELAEKYNFNWDPPVE